jgi:GNAT superfamily N-acetyltransferase
MALETDIWIPELRAPREKFQVRLRDGHRIVSVRRRGNLMGMVGWRYADFSLDDPDTQFPGNFTEFSSGRLHDPVSARSAYIYSVGVRPNFRENGIGSLLLQHAVDKIREAGVTEIFVDSRMPAYNGSQQSDREDIPRDPGFHQAIERYFSENRFPGETEFAADPRIRLYIRNGFKPWQLLRDFIQDEASGNMRVVCYMNLVEDQF